MTARSSGSSASAARARSSSASSLGSGSPFTSIGPRTGRITDSMTWTSSPWAAWGRSRGTAGVTMIFAVTMKITSSTSITSTSGVTLMPEMIPFAGWPLGAAIAHLAQPRRLARTARVIGDVGQHQVGEHLRAREQRGDPPLQVVVGRDRGQRDQDADGRRDQRLGDAGHHRLGRHLARGGGAVSRGGMAELLEGVDDADDGAEQTDEGRVVTNGGQER